MAQMVIIIAMKLKQFSVPIMGLLLFACNSDDSNGTPSDEIAELEKADFIVIGEDLENVYQFTYNGRDETSEQISLTEQLNIIPNYLTLREVDDLISFYFFANGAFSLVFKDVRTGSSATYTDFFVNGPERSEAWGINNESNVVLGFFGPFGARNLGVRDIDLQMQVGTDTYIDEDVDFVFQPLLFDNKVFFAYQDNSGDYKLSFYDMDGKTKGPVLNFGAVPVSFLFSESDELIIIKNGTSPEIEFYDPNTLDFIEMQRLELNTGFPSGPIEGAVLKGNFLYYAFPYAQPSNLPSGPAIFDLQSQTNQLVDLFSMVEQIESDLGSGIVITTQMYDGSRDMFFVGYGTLGNEARGGVLQISNNGELVTNVELPFFPTYIVKN